MFIQLEQYDNRGAAVGRTPITNPIYVDPMSIVMVKPVSGSSREGGAKAKIYLDNYIVWVTQSPAEVVARVDRSVYGVEQPEYQCADDGCHACYPINHDMSAKGDAQ